MYDFVQIFGRKYKNITKGKVNPIDPEESLDDAKEENEKTKGKIMGIMLVGDNFNHRNAYECVGNRERRTIFLYGYIDEDETEIYSIIKMRTGVNNRNKDSGVAVPFREMDITLLREEYDKEALGKELYYLSEMPDKVSDDESVRSYFANASNQTNYLLADVYVELILARDNVSGDGTFMVADNVLPRVTERLEESPQVYDSTTGFITVSNLDNLTIDERQCLLVSRAGTINYNAFAAEIVAHAWATKKAPEFIFIDEIFYESAKKADLGVAESDDSYGIIFEYFFAHEDSIFVEQQRGIFGEQ